eukprot:g7455.t1
MNLDEEDSAGESSSKSIYDESLYAGAADAANRATPTSSLKRTNDALLALVKDSASSADVGGESFLEHGAASLGDSPPEDPEGETKTTLATTEEQPPEDRPLLHQPDDPNEDARWRHFEEATRALLFDDPETEAHRSARVNSLQQRVRDFSKKLSDRHAAEDSAAAAAALQVQETTTTPTLQVDTNAPPGTSSSSTSAVELGKEMQHTQTKQQEEMALAPRRDPKLRDVSREDMKDSWAQVRDSVSDLKDKIKRIGADDATVLGSAQKVRDSLRSAKSHVADMLMQETVDPENPTGEDVGGAQASGGTTTGAAADAQPKGA